jgi:6-phosphofructokinase 1
MSKASTQNTVGILVGGGPAPGLNGVIHAVTITAINHGYQVMGILEGFKHLMAGQPQFVPLTIADVSRIHLRGGTILRTARANPKENDDYLRNTVSALKGAGITHLVSIGGDDTASSAYAVSRYAQKEMKYNLRSVHVPKTIDNDLPLPEGVPTFGYETAREVGTRVVENIMEDARSAVRWYLIVAMGRSAGHLALGIGKSAGATLTLIPEEWRGETIRLQEIGDIISGAVIKRLASGRGHGVVVVAEGVIAMLDPDDVESLENVERDEHGHVRLSEVDSGAIIKNQVSKILDSVGIKMRIVDKEVGYELRCADPCAFDIDYTRSLGEAAASFLAEGGTNAMMSLQNNCPVPIPYDEIIHPETGRAQVRRVNVDSYTYHSARKFMIRLEAQDFGDPQWVEKLAGVTKLSPAEFTARFGYLGGAALRPF